MFGKFIKIFTERNPPFDPNADEQFFLNRYGNIIDMKNGKAYFELNPLRYKIHETIVIDRLTDDGSIRRGVEYTRYELTEDNKILDKVTNKLYDDFEDIVSLLNVQNQFIDKTKDVLDFEIQALNRAARYESEVAEDVRADTYMTVRDRLKEVQVDLFPK